MNVKEFNAYNFMVRRLTNTIERARKARLELATKLQQGDLEAVEAVRWLQGSPQLFLLSALCAELLAALDKADESQVSEVHAAFVERVKARLESWTPESSSSQFSNTTNNELYAALREFIRDHGSAL